MKLRALLRFAAGIALALFVVASWSTPSEAHSGHEVPALQAQGAESHPAAYAAAPAEQVAPASEDCGGHMGQPGSDRSTCCSNTCHAVMSAALAELREVAVAAALLPELPSPAEVTAPTAHIKRPPRPSAALVG